MLTLAEFICIHLITLLISASLTLILIKCMGEQDFTNIYENGLCSECSEELTDNAEYEEYEEEYESNADKSE